MVQSRVDNSISSSDLIFSPTTSRGLLARPHIESAGGSKDVFSLLGSDMAGSFPSSSDPTECHPALASLNLVAVLFSCCPV